MVTAKPLWTCPKCQQKFVSKNMAHSCTTASLDDYFRDKDPKFRVLYGQFLQLVERICGKVIVNINKTRISFQARTRFVAINALTEPGIKAHIVTKQKLTSPRFFKVEKIGNCYVQHFLLRDAKDLDEELKGWIRQAYKYGRQEH